MTTLEVNIKYLQTMYSTDKKDLTSNHTLMRKEEEGQIDSWDVFLEMTEPGWGHLFLATESADK